MKKFIVSLTLFIFCCSYVFGVDIRMKNGQEYDGYTITSETENEITITSPGYQIKDIFGRGAIAYDTTTLQKSAIESMAPGSSLFKISQADLQVEQYQAALAIQSIKKDQDTMTTCAVIDTVLGCLALAAGIFAGIAVYNANNK